MPSKNSEKDKESKEAIKEKLTPILVINNSKYKPYIELFENYPENVLLKSLGTLAGFFKIDALDDDSSYIVNFLTSILKKEYYSNHKRTVSDSFDAALKKVNLALSELAKQGNVSWLGKLDGAVCVIEKNNFHFTVCGKSKILLLRNQLLNDISKDLADDSAEPNPLKTFSDVSSGQLFPKDKLIITTEDIFQLFSLPQIKKSALRFSSDKFVQFVKTALVNELKLAGTIIIDISEPEKEAEEKARIKKKREEKLNVFSEKTFREANSLNIKNISQLAAESLKKDYVDKKTGHIYIQGDETPVKNEGEIHNYSEKMKYMLSDFFYNLKEKLRFFAAKRFRKMKNSLSEKMKRKEKPLEIKEEPVPPVPAPMKIKNEPPREYLPEPEGPERNNYFKDSSLRVLTILKYLPIKISAFLKLAFKKIIPDFSKIKNIFQRFSYQQKLYSILIIILIFIVPFYFVKFQKRAEVKSQPQVQSTQKTTAEVLAGKSEKNLKPLSDVESLSFIQDPVKLVLLNGRIFVVTSSQIISWDSNGAPKQSDFPSDFQGVKLTTPMNDLNLIFLVSNDNKIISFSPVDSSFSENNITIPANSDLKNAGTYMTYLYLTDAASNQIYRYPRAAGGFGSETNWLKDGTDVKSATDMAMDENIYLLENNQVIKLFKGAKVDLNLEPVAVAPQLSSLFTTADDQNLYLLDTEYGRVIEYSKDGTLVAQYQDDKIKNATSFTVDEPTNKLYFLSSDNNIYDASLE